MKKEVITKVRKVKKIIPSDFKFIERMITEVYPKGIVSVIMDTYDYFRVLTEFLPLLKEKILNRDGKVVCRPDSGNPVYIICGDPNAIVGSPEYKGSIELLWDIFGGTINSKGYKELDPHIGLIYGDSITLERATAILEGLKAKGFASTNVVFGIGSFTYQFNTRDTFGQAIKATHAIVDGVEKPIFKNPKTDSGIKRSAKGLLRVNDDYTLSENVSWDEESGGLLQTVFCDGFMYNEQNLSQIRERLKNSNKGS